MILEGKESVFDTELFTPIISQIEKISGKLYAESASKRPMRIIADHVRASTFIIADGVAPANKEQGSILRRLIRRSIRFGRILGIDELFLPKIAEIVIENYKDVYPELEREKTNIVSVFNNEEEKFAKTISDGLREFEKLMKSGIIEISGDQAFYLYETFGFPLELTQELAQEKGMKVDINGFQENFAKHQEKSRAGAMQKFQGGLADHSEETTKLHTATHLLQQALRMVLGTHVHQVGSNITVERLRFDFTHDKKMTPEEIQKVEEIVNDQIKKNLGISFKTETYDEAVKEGALAFFGERYGEKVKVYSMGDYSKEVCGGPHVDFTGALGSFKINKEEASGSGKRRIYATLVKQH